MKKKVTIFSKKVIALMLSISMCLAFVHTVHATTAYNLFIGDTQVTSDNKNNIFNENGVDGNPTAKYDDTTKTLYLNGVNIVADYKTQDETISSSLKPPGTTSLYAGTDTVKNLVITGENSFTTTDNGMWFMIDKEPLTVTGDGTLTSTSTAEYLSDSEEDYYAIKRTGTAFSVVGSSASSKFVMGNNDGSGPTLKLSAWNIALYLQQCASFEMNGGTIIAQGKNPTYSYGGYLTDTFNYMQGGTLALYGNTKTITEEDKVGGAFNSRNYGLIHETTLGKKHGMQRVYPVPNNDNDDDDNIDIPRFILDYDGWNVVGMTAEGFKDQTNNVMKILQDEYGLDVSSGANSYHTDTLPDSSLEIDVQGFTNAKTIYSVDVEWGAMTFEYEKSRWNTETHTKTTGRGWVVYDNVNDQVIESQKDPINCITVTNHSNAGVFATLSYNEMTGYDAITGSFTKKEDDTTTIFSEATDAVPAYLTLDSADNNKGKDEGQGEETIGKVYFMPNGIPTTNGTVNDIEQWTKIGKITVGITTEQPQ